MSIQPNLTRMITFPPAGGLGLSLSHLGHVGPLTYSYATPGGCDQASCTLFDPPRKRSEALTPGRIVKLYRGGSVVWSGILDEPTPTAQGWQITAHGAGTVGNDYLAIWTGTWGTGVFDNAVNAAIARGLPWDNPGIGSPAGIWTGQQVDSGSQTITDLLNLGCTKGGLTWQVTSGPGDQSQLNVFPLPTVANRILIATSPEAQSIASGPNSLYLRYQNSPDTVATSSPATYALTNVQAADQIASQGLREDYADLSSAGTLTASAAQGVGSSILQRFTRAGFTAPFTLNYGDLTNLGGVPVDPGVYYQDSAQVMVCRAILSDFSFSGEVTRGPVIFVVGQYQWDDGACQAQVTPFGSIRYDFSSLVSAAVDSIPVRVQATKKKKKGR